MDEKDDETLFCLHDGVPAEQGTMVIREALNVLRSRLAELWVDVVGRWPPDVEWAATAGERPVRRVTPPRKWYRRHPQPDESIRLDPRIDEDFAIMHALAPYTIGGTGVDPQGRDIYDADDEGTSAAFCLTPAEYDLLCDRLRTAGVDPGWLYRVEQDRA